MNNQINLSKILKLHKFNYYISAGQTMKVVFDRLFELTLTADCTSEYVELRDGGTSGSKIIGKFCGYR